MSGIHGWGYIHQLKPTYDRSDKEEDLMTHRLVLGALLVALGATAFWTTSQAQDSDQTCQEQCQEIQEQCRQECNEHANPIECSSQCEDEGWDCRNRCR